MIRCWVGAVPAVLLAALLSGCGLLDSERAFRDQDVTVIDASGLVRSVEALPAQLGAIDQVEPRAEKGESLTVVRLSWTGSSCVEAWTIRLAGNALVAVIEPGPRQSGATLDCYGAPVGRSVLLQMNRVVDAGDIDVSLADAAGSSG